MPRHSPKRKTKTKMRATDYYNNWETLDPYQARSSSHHNPTQTHKTGRNLALLEQCEDTDETFSDEPTSASSNAVQFHHNQLPDLLTLSPPPANRRVIGHDQGCQHWRGQDESDQPTPLFPTCRSLRKQSSGQKQYEQLSDEQSCDDRYQPHLMEDGFSANQEVVASAGMVDSSTDTMVYWNQQQGRASAEKDRLYHMDTHGHRQQAQQYRKSGIDQKGAFYNHDMGLYEFRSGGAETYTAEGGVVDEFKDEELDDRDRGLRRRVCIGLTCIILIGLAIAGVLVGVVFRDQIFKGSGSSNALGTNNLNSIAAAQSPTRSPTRSPVFTTTNEFLPKTLVPDSSTSDADSLTQSTGSPTSATSPKPGTSSSLSTTQPSVGELSTGQATSPLFRTSSPSIIADATASPSSLGGLPTKSPTAQERTMPPTTHPSTATGSPTIEAVTASPSRRLTATPTANLVPNETETPATREPTQSPTDASSTANPTLWPTHPPSSPDPTAPPSPQPTIATRVTSSPSENPAAPREELMNLHKIEILTYIRSASTIDMSAGIKVLSPRIISNGNTYIPFPCFATSCDPYIETNIYEPITLPSSNEWFLKDPDSGNTDFGNKGLPSGELELRITFRDGDDYVWYLDPSRWARTRVGFETFYSRDVQGNGDWMKWKFDVLPAGVTGWP
ncbi:expressed unknown protein [Seminavis robusta]|uniref:Uncharacterized protein n=1 Tax=Seminavis robusta TaxID=568900 RepID=A0A9N8DGV5_9STRA|nr:expressed unknown protein [Seminavis robusta]|eukprot:Sro152_g069510.1 n/a (673) ;mRNA; r:62897-64915